MKNLLLALATVAALPATAQEVRLKFHHIWNPQAMASVNVIAPWCEKIAKESANKLKCQVLPAMSGGRHAAAAGRPRQGRRRRHRRSRCPATRPAASRSMEVFELPFMTNSAEVGARAAWDYLQQVRDARSSRAPSCWRPGSTTRATSTPRDKPVKTLADFKGLKMRAPTRQTNKLLSALGASPVGMPLPAIPDAVEQGHDRRLPAAVGGDALAQAAGDGQVPQRDRPVAPGAVQRGVRLRDEPGQVRQPAAGPEEGDRQQQRRRRCRSRSARSGTTARPPAARRRRTAATPSTRCPAAELDNWVKASAPLYDEWVADMDKRGCQRQADAAGRARPAGQVQEVIGSRGRHARRPRGRRCLSRGKAGPC